MNNFAQHNFVVINNVKYDLFSKCILDNNEKEQLLSSEGWEVVEESGFTYTYVNLKNKQLLNVHLWENDHSIQEIELYTANVELQQDLMLTEDEI
jgi:hypothetical protein